MNETREGAVGMPESTEVDVVVLGVGTCGEDLSLRLLGAGLDVVGIEAHLVGGECAFWACLPSKLMIRAANLLHEARSVAGKAGLADVTADWPLLAARVRSEVTGGWDDSNGVARFEARGGRLIHGHGKLTGPATVAVADETFTARRGIVIATGSKPAVPPIAGLDKAGYWNTHDVIAAEELPASVIVLGGGAVGCELGQVMSRFGADVTIVEASERLLPSGEPEASAALEAALEAEGIHVYAGVPVEGIERRDGSVAARLGDGMELTADQLVVATGRRIDLADLGLESAGLDGGARRLEVDENLRVAEGIWAMGDVTGRAMFTHVALYQSAIVAAEILGEEHPPARYDAVPRVTFTDPEVGSVGITEAEARVSGQDAITVTKQLGATFRGWLHGAGGIIKLVVDRETGLLLGATVVGPRAGEMLGMLELAMHAGVPVAELQGMIYAFPTFYGSIGEMIGAYGRGLSTVIDPGYEGFSALDRAGGD